MYLYITCNVKLDIQNKKIKAINQHKNDTCYILPLENDFYLGAPWLLLLCYHPQK